MLKKERQDYILREINLHNKIKVTDTAEVELMFTELSFFEIFYSFSKKTGLK